MTETIQLNQQTENTFDFELEIDGLTSVEVTAWLVIKTKGIELSFPCTQSGNNFSCKIPPIPFIERTAYSGCIRLVADDYFFEPVTNLLVNVTGNLSFEPTDIKNMTLKSDVKGDKKVKKSESKKEDKKQVKENKNNFRVFTETRRINESSIKESTSKAKIDEHAIRDILKGHTAGKRSSTPTTRAKFIRKNS